MAKFKDPIAPKQRKQGFPFQAPTKENATTGRFYAAGDDYGIGHKQPCGHYTATNEGPIPRESKCWSAEEHFLD